MTITLSLCLVNGVNQFLFIIERIASLYCSTWLRYTRMPSWVNLREGSIMLQVGSLKFVWTTINVRSSLASCSPGPHAPFLISFFFHIVLGVLFMAKSLQELANNVSGLPLLSFEVEPASLGSLSISSEDALPGGGEVAPKLKVKKNRDQSIELSLRPVSDMRRRIGLGHEHCLIPHNVGFH